MRLVPTGEKVQIKWFVWTAGQKFVHESTMRGQWGWDASCSCGWETRTGGATKGCVQTFVEEHKVFEHDYKLEFSKKYQS